MRRGAFSRRGPLLWLAALLALYLVAPIVVLLVHLASGARGGLATAGVGAALWVSLLTATISAGVIAILGIPLAWALAHGRGRLWDAVGVAVQLPLALPPLMSGILLVEVVGPYTLLGRLTGGRLTDSLAGIVIAQTFVAAPFLVIAARSAFGTVDPQLLDMAAVLGHGRWSRFLRVSLPIAGPGIRAGLLLSWLRAFGEFGATVILAYHPYSLPVFAYVQFSSTGLPSTLVPSAAAVAAAAVVLGLTRWRPGRWAWRALAPLVHRLLPTGEKPPLRRGAPRGAAGRDLRPPQLLTFDLSTVIGSFRLRVAHSARAANLAILGPSGAGKSLTLRTLAGLQGASAGTVRLGGRGLERLAPEARRIGWVPQEPALFPHLTVARQLTFAPGTAPKLAEEWLRRLGLWDLRDRLPAELSGGQRQRVALARALAREPDLLLLDEPFSSLDRPLRDRLRRELRHIQQRTAVATVLVTHDPEEAALLADELVVLSEGRALQAGTRSDVLHRPASVEVARLLGIDNVGEGEVVAPGLLRSDGTELVLAEDTPSETGTAVSWCLRAEHVVVDPPPGAALPRLEASVIDALDLGAGRELMLRVEGGLRLTARTMGGERLGPGDRCSVAIDPHRLTVWPAAEHPRQRSPQPAG